VMCMCCVCVCVCFYVMCVCVYVCVCVCVCMCMWVTGQKIDNEEYAKAIQIVGSSRDMHMDNGDVELFDHPIENEFTWKEHLYGELVFDSTEIMSHVPFKSLSEDEINEEIESRLSNVPSWFKRTALWWSWGLISDKEFVQSIQYLKEQGSIDPYFDFRFLN